MANRYWVGGTADWNATAGTKWALTSGGAGGQAVPTATDDVFLDANSGAVTITTTATARCLNFNSTGFTGTLTLNSGLITNASIVLGSGMTFAGTGQLLIRGSGNNTLTTNGVVIRDIDMRPATGSMTLQDNLTLTSLLDISGGTVNLNGKTVSVPIFELLGTTATSLTFNGATLNATTLADFSSVTTGDTVTFDTGTINTPIFFMSTDATFSAGTSTINITDGDGVFDGAGRTYHNVNFTGATNPGHANSISVSGSNTFNIITINPNLKVVFTAGTTQTMYSLSARGTSGNTIVLDSSTTSTHSLVKTGGGTISCDYLNIQHSVATPATTWYAGANSTNNQAVATAGSGWVFTTPPSDYFLQMT